MKNLMFLFILIAVFYSCSKEKICKPEWISILSDSITGQIVVNVNRDTLLFTELNNYSYIRDDLDELLQSDTADVRFNYLNNIYKPNKSTNELIFDSSTYVYSSLNGIKLSTIKCYKPQRDLLRYLESNCGGYQLAILGCTSEFELCNNYKGNRIVLTYYDRHFKEESHPKKIGFVIYKDGILIAKLRIENYQDIENQFIQYFATNNAVYIHHSRKSLNGEWEMVTAKFSFDTIINMGM